MKIKYILAIGVLSSFANAIDFNLEAGGWYIDWEQTSTSSDFVKKDALDVKYDIDKSIAAVIRGDLDIFNGINGSFEYYTTKLSSNDKKEIKGYNIGLSILDKIPYIDVETKIIKSDFKGSIEAVDTSDESTLSSGTFKTKVNIWDFIVYPFNKYVGVGYRLYKYDFPQDVYLIRNSDDTLLKKGLINVEYKGHFYTLSVNNRRFTSNLKEYKGFVYDITGGVGKLEPKAPGFDKYIEKSDASFLDLYGGYSYKVNEATKAYGITLGFRYNKIETKANKTSGDYSLMTEFNTEFYGPFINLNYKF